MNCKLTIFLKVEAVRGCIVCLYIKKNNNTVDFLFIKKMNKLKVENVG